MSWHIILADKAGVSKSNMNTAYFSRAKTDQKLTFIADYLIEHNETLSVAESVTSGHLQSIISSADRASYFYQGGITTYNLNQKTRHLGIEPLKALSNNCVSEEIAREMALGVCKLFASDWGIATTGYASCLPDQGITTLFAFYSFAYRGKILLNNILVSKHEKDSKEVQRYYASSIVASLARYIQPLPASKMESPVMKQRDKWIDALHSSSNQ